MGLIFIDNKIDTNATRLMILVTKYTIFIPKFDSVKAVFIFLRT